MPEEDVPHTGVGMRGVGDFLGSVAKGVLWDTPKAMVDAAKTTPYGLRREDYTDVPPDTSPDPNSPLGGIGVNVPRGEGSHLDPMIRPALETGLNVMAGTAFSAPGKAAGEFVAGAGPGDPRLWHGISKVKLPKPIDEMSAVHVPTEGAAAERVINPASLQGGRLLPLIGDRTGAGTQLTRVNGYQFNTPVQMQGGHGFMANNADNGAAWASGQGVATRLANTIQREAKEGPLYGVYTAMGERSGDFSHHVSDALTEMMKHTKVQRGAKTSFNDEMRAIAPDWPGLNSPTLRQWLTGAPGAVRARFVKLMDTAKYQSAGFPSVAEARFATTDPRRLNEQTGAAGLSMARLDPSGKTFSGPGQHLTYDTNIGGQYVGGLPASVPKEIMFPDIVNPLEKYRAALPGYKPTVDYLMQRTPTGLPLVQKADQRWVDTISKHLEGRGFTLGAGATDKRAAGVAAVDDVLARERALAPQWYSQLDRAMEGVSQPAMSAEQWGGVLRNAGVKQDEMDWRGVSKLLAERSNQPVTREEMAAHLKSNPMPQLKPVEYAAPDWGKLSNDEQWKWEDRWRQTGGRNGRYDSAEDMFDDYARRGDIEGGPHYGEYQLPGAENTYRERLLTLPVRRDARGDITGHEIGGPNYKSPHWGEPNVLFHRRSTDREFTQPLTPEQQAAVEARRVAEGQLNGVRQQRNIVAREIRDAAKPLEQARKDAIMADYFAKRVPGPETQKRLMEYGDFPELKPLQDRLQALRAEEDAIRKAMPEEPKPTSIRSLHAEEGQSDWQQAARLKEQFDAAVAERSAAQTAQDEALKRNAGRRGDPAAEAEIARAAQASAAAQEKYQKILARSGGRPPPPVPEGPLKKTWHEALIKDMLREAAEKGYKRISWTAGRSQPTNPKNLQRGVVDPRHEDVASGLEGFYDKIWVDYLNKIGKPHGVKVERSTLPNTGGLSGSEAMDRMGIPRTEQKAFWDDLVNNQPHGAREAFMEQARAKGHDTFYMDVPDSLRDEALYKGFRLGAGASDKRAAGVAALNEVDRILDAERSLKGAAREPGPAATAVPDQPAPAGPTPTVGPGGGGAAGSRSIPEAQATAARWAGERKPLEGIPGALKIGEDYFVPGPIAKVHDVAEDYMRNVGRPYNPPTRYHPVDPEHSKAIAQAYEEMKHTPKDPATVASYNALIDETKAQYEAIKKTGLKIEPIPAGAADPYAANPRLAAVDVAENNHLWFFPTEQGFGTLNKISDNPMLRKTGEKIGDHELLANDMFRIVHDYFGHLKQGHGFRAAGEDNAWRTHAAMYSDLARPAMTTETRGQNSWVNYGPHGEKNRTASGADTVYADQKIGLLPDWVMYDRGQAPPMMYHGSAADYLKPSLERIGSGQGQMAYGAGYYGSAKERVAKKYRDMQQQNIFTKNGQPTDKLAPYAEMYDSLVASGVSPGRSDHVAEAIVNMMEMGWSPARIAKGAAAEGMDKEFAAALKVARNYKAVRDPGHMYKWAIEADPKHFLDWDQRWAKQTPHVQGRVGEDMERSIATQRAALEKKIERLLRGEDDLRYRGRPGAEIMRERNLFEAQQRLQNLGLENFSGKDIYTRMGLPARSMEEGYVRSSQRLSEKGIPGLQYKNVSGGADSGARNFVIFNPDTVRLLRKYGLIGLPASGLAADLMDGEGFATGGAVDSAMSVARQIKRAKGGKVHVGPITGDTGGRADKVPMRVPNGAYVLTSDHVSGLGEGNTEAGMKKLSAMFPKSKPSKLRQLPADEAIPIYAADGEFVISPDDIVDRFGELDYGHRALDEWQTQERQQLIKTLQGLAPPAID